MTAPEADAYDAAEQRQTPGRDAAATRAVELPAEAGAYDAVEQAADAGPGEHVAGRDLPLEADPADAAEQAVVVELDEDEGR